MTQEHEMSTDPWREGGFCPNILVLGPQVVCKEKFPSISLRIVEFIVTLILWQIIFYFLAHLVI